jgi:hypothetical protein
MATHCFTCATLSYLARARVLASSLRRHHPDWVLWLLIADASPEETGLNVADQAFDHSVWIEELRLPNFKQWCFQHDVVELCTAVKGFFLQRLLTSQADKIVYLDPDISLFHSLDDIERMLDSHDVLLTPHQLDFDDDPQAILDNELGSLRTGLYNLGFLGVRNSAEGRRFARWWTARLQSHCYDEPERGLFVDQKWANFVPLFFSGVGIVRDPGCNVASWNLRQRRITITGDGRILASGSPLKFFHFSKLGPIGDAMTRRHAGDNVEVYELWAWYRRMVARHAEADLPPAAWRFGQFDNGEPIPLRARRRYRERPDLQEAFPDPFSTADGGYYQWLAEHGC